MRHGKACSCSPQGLSEAASSNFVMCQMPSSATFGISRTRRPSFGNFAMNKPAAIMGSLVDARNVATHKCLRLVIDVPAEQAEHIIKVLGWPTQVNPIPVAVARLNPELPSPSSHQTSPGNFDATGGVSPPLPGTDGRKPGAQSKSWSSMSPAQQAGIRCADPLFQQFLLEKMKIRQMCNASDAANAVRVYCGVASRAHINVDPSAGLLWHRLDGDFSIWKHHPELVP